MFLLLLACNSSVETTEEYEDFLSDISNKWWSLEKENKNFYLERYGESNSGYLWLDYAYGPAPHLDWNIDGGEWQYVSDRKFEVIDVDYQMEFILKAKDSEQEGCYKITYKLYVDEACLYDETITNLSD